MSALSTHTTLHSRLCYFIGWIKPDPDKRDDNGEKASRVRSQVKQNAEEDGTTIKSTPAGGSDEKDTGIRRHYRGHSEVDGYDIDLPFVVASADAEGKSPDELLVKFEKYVRKTYSNSEINQTNSSVHLKLYDELSFDIVPMLTTDKDDEQIIIKRDGTRFRTSVQKHNEFIKKRTKKSKELAGRVTFNECVRAVKWWREFQADNSYYLSYNEDTKKDDRPPSALIDWLCAHAFDHLGVERTYAETFAKWFGFLANVVRQRKAVFFPDYYSAPPLVTGTGWSVLDPVNPNNNITSKWDQNKLNEFATWFENARDSWSRIVRYEEDGDDGPALDELIKLFGNPFKNHCEEK